MILGKMFYIDNGGDNVPRRIILDSAYLARIKKEDDAIAASLAALVRRKVPCKYCSCRTIDKFEDLKAGHFSAFCSRCGQVGIYEAADYRHYSYEVTATIKKHYA